MCLETGEPDWKGCEFGLGLEHGLRDKPSLSHGCLVAVPRHGGSVTWMLKTDQDGRISDGKMIKTWNLQSDAWKSVMDREMCMYLEKWIMVLSD